jgi:hypothetical protein
MNRRQQWALAALALALAAGTARAQTGYGSSTSLSASYSVAAPAVTWEFTTTREGGEARLQMQAGPGAAATCQSITLRVSGTPVTLTTDGQKVRVQSSPSRGRRIEASADRVTCGEALTLYGNVQARFDLKSQCAQIIKGERVTFNPRTDSIEVSGAGSLGQTGPTPVSLDFGFPVVKPAAEKDKAQTFDFFLGFSR